MHDFKLVAFKVHIARKYQQIIILVFQSEMVNLLRFYGKSHYGAKTRYN